MSDAHSLADEDAGRHCTWALIMWILKFKVRDVIDVRNVKDKPVHKSYTVHVDANEMFDIIKYGSYDEFEGMSLIFEGEGRSPKRGVRIFENVTLVISD